MNLTEKITEVKPNLKPNTIKQYEAQLNKLKKSFDTDDWDFITDIDAVKQSVKNLLLTQRGERLFNPNIGSGIFEQLFDNVDVYTFESIRNKIKDMISSLEPRVGKIKVNIQDNAELNAMAVSVHFNIIGTPGDQTIDFYLERLR